MNRDRRDSIGIKQVVPFAKMRLAATLAAGGLPPDEFRRALLASFDGTVVKGGAPLCEENKRNVVAMLARAWRVADGEDGGGYGKRAAGLLRDADGVESKAVFWGLMCAAYPFWFRMAECVGRLLRLQEGCTLAQVTARMKEVYGDRTTVQRYAQYAMRSFVDWGVLEDRGGRGCYGAAEKTPVDNPRIVAFLYEALVESLGGEADVLALASHPALFCFSPASLTAQEAAAENPAFECVGTGLTATRLRLRARGDVRAIP